MVVGWRPESDLYVTISELNYITSVVLLFHGNFHECAVNEIKPKSRYTEMASDSLPRARCRDFSYPRGVIFLETMLFDGC